MQILRPLSCPRIVLSAVAACAVTLSIAVSDRAHAQALSGEGSRSASDVSRLIARLERLEAFTRETTPTVERLRRATCSGKNNFLAVVGDGEAVVCRKKRP